MCCVFALHYLSVITLKVQVSDTMDRGTTTLTPKNIIKQMYKFYRENLHPTHGKTPSFKHVLMWALQTGQYSIDWQFTFGKQLSWSAAEAAWKLTHQPDKADWDVVQAAFFIPDKYDGSWADDGYTDTAYADLANTAAILKDDENTERADRIIQAAQEDSESEEEGESDVETTPNSFIAYLESLNPAEQSESAGNIHDQFILPQYAEETAQRMAARPRSPSPTLADYRREAAQEKARYSKKRKRYIDDEASESDS